MIEIGIDSFAAKPSRLGISDAQAINELLERIVYADEVGLDVFGLGEHYRKEFLDSASYMLLAAAASRTKNIKLTSAVTVLSAADPVRVFQNFATLDLISNGRAEIVTGRGSFIESFPLFGYDLHDYDALFTEKLDLLLKIRDNEFITWEGAFRPALQHQPVYPRPMQEKLPIWIGVGGTPASFARAGALGLPLMVAIIGGETRRFKPLVDLYRQAGAKAGFAPEELQVGLHSLGYVANTKEEAIADYYPGYAEMFTKIGIERGFGPVTRGGFDAQNGHYGALLVSDPEEVAHKIIRHSESLGGISRFTFQMDAGIPHEKLMQAIHLIGTKVKPILMDAK
ncbi:MAG TPA: LLM class flavin-dependent oxidoreductase [Chitinophagales bacterium]|nr:LLM class flavin-dependent oxidoreductase [Chitinophagales bacterium]HNA57276.1 LLM class flavin-dependent oxidoreductase [Chitinophagales bacterium]HNE47098.1 LLM class flavin-dependent oxidoreductase [Chitinophagales bacterium]HNF68388.1 LLM class flavin-dependent oxidoreductase [Chitinophagales bacterium]HNI53839.1 LLM class flavin-dependent oxidoreductase [Chitinophagales bacterium]